MNAIAAQYGFFWETLWNHQQNAELKAQRKNPAVLLPGDRVFIPEKRSKEESGSTGQVHTFRMKGVPAWLNLRIVDEWGEPRAGLSYTLLIDGQKRTGVVPKDGLISQSIHPRAKSACLKLETGEEWSLQLGWVNPVEYASGVQARLKNLGYQQGEVSGKADDITREAIQRFQADQDLAPSGEADTETRAALVRSHGT
jgi:N-acetylmuramoyl-L-alanine amidase